MIVSLLGFVVFTLGRFVLSYLFSIVIISLGDERSGLSASRTFVC